MFGQALVRSIGAPARQARQERAEFLKIAPTLIQQGVLEPTTSDDPAAVKFGRKPLSVGGVSFKTKEKGTSLSDIETALDIQLKQQKLAGTGLVSQKALEDFFLSDQPTSPSVGIRTKFQPRITEAEQELQKAQQSGDPSAMAAAQANLQGIRGEMNAQMALEFQELQSAYGRNPQAFIMGPGGVPQFMVKDGSKARPATVDELKRASSLTPATEQQLAVSQEDQFKSLLKEVGTPEAKALLEDMKKGKKAPPLTAGALDRAAADIAAGTTSKVSGGLTESPGVLAALGFAAGKVGAPFISGALPGGFPGQALLAPKAPLNPLTALLQRAGIRAGAGVGPALSGAAKLAGPIAAGSLVGRDVGKFAQRAQESLAPGLTGLVADPVRFLTDPAFRQFSLESQPSANVQAPGFLESINPLNVNPFVPSGLQTGAAQEIGQTDFSQLLPLLETINSGR
jgi:hypothetical protein